MNPDYSASLSFLSQWSPSGPWVLTAIAIERKGIETRTFRPEDDVHGWLDVVGQNHNLYFHVNPVLRDVSKKATREDIAELAWLHVDIDPRAGEDLEEERERALALLRNPPGTIPAPTVIVFSGGGYQGFWKLREPLPINGAESAYEDAKRYNQQLEIEFGADNCHNVDRIMRLPGSLNRPDKKKREKGRQVALAKVVEWVPERVYDLSQFLQAPEVQKGNEFGFSPRIAQVSGNIEPFPNGVDDPRLAQVNDYCKVIIVQGFDPEDPTKFAKHNSSELDRSAAVFYVACELVRSGCDDDTIFAVLMDPDFGISASILDKGARSEQYALRQIERAREDAIDPQLRELNEKHAVIRNWNGKCRVVEEIYDRTLKRFRLTKQSFEDFRNGYMNRFVEVNTGDGKTINIPLGKWWLQHQHRRQYDTIVFAPGHDIPGTYNLWRGFACEAKPGDHGLFLEHLQTNICQGNAEHYDYLIRWMANAVQHPDRPGYSAIVMRGPQGTGKSFIAKTLGALFGRHFMQVSDPKHLVGSFNAHLRDCVILFADEAFYAGDKKHESILKMLITEGMLVIEPKGVDAEMSANCVHLLMASNDSWVVPAGLDDRRFFVLDVSEEQKENSAYFGAMSDQLENGGLESLLHYLMQMDLKGFDVRTVPKTKALQDQKLHSMDPAEEWWFNKLQSGLLLDEHAKWETKVFKLDLQNDFISYARMFNNTRRGNATKLGQTLNRFLPEGFPLNEQLSTPVQIIMPDGKEKMVRRPYQYTFPKLEECRAHWDKKFGGPYDWSKPIDDMDTELRAIPFA